jgi:hypothetical protein
MLQHWLCCSPCCTELPPHLVRTLTVCVHSISTCIHLVAGGTHKHVPEMNLEHIASVMTDIISYSADVTQPFPQPAASSSSGAASRGSRGGIGTSGQEPMCDGERSNSVTLMWCVLTLLQGNIYMVWHMCISMCGAVHAPHNNQPQAAGSWECRQCHCRLQTPTNNV